MQGSSSSPNDPVTSILTLFEARGGSEYGGEAVTQEEHALQVAACAMEDGCDDALVTAALLHDIGPQRPALRVVTAADRRAAADRPSPPFSEG